MEALNTLRCSIDDHQLAYSVSGNGVPVLLVHGITTYSFIWRNIVPLMRDHYQVLTVDLLGCGESSKEMNQPYSLPNHARLLKTFLDTLGVKKLHFVGHDLGGGIGQIFAVDYPEMLYDLTLINSVAYDFWPVQPILSMRTPIIRQFAMAALDAGALRLLIRRGLYHKEKSVEELVELFARPLKTRQGRKAFLHFAASLDNRHLIEIADQLHQLDLPVLILRGDADKFLSAAICEKLAHNLKDAKLVRIPTGSHFIQEDEPEMIATALHSFFRKQHV